jgi:hypothetical protein
MYAMLLLAVNGHLAVLQWARSQDPPCDWNIDVCSSAAENDSLVYNIIHILAFPPLMR